MCREEAGGAAETWEILLTEEQGLVSARRHGGPPGKRVWREGPAEVGYMSPLSRDSSVGTLEDVWNHNRVSPSFLHLKTCVKQHRVLDSRNLVVTLKDKTSSSQS